MRYLMNIGIILAIFAIAGCTQKTNNFESLAIIKSISGEVYYHPADMDKRIRLQSSDVNRQIFNLDKLIVAKDSFLHLKFVDQGDLFVEPESSLIIQKPETKSKFKVFAKLLNGVFSCFIEKQNSNFAVQTPVTVAGVLGTTFQVDVKPEGTNIVLVESEKGIELQSLDQSLTNPPILKVTTSKQGKLIGSAISIDKELSMETAPYISDNIRNVENIHTFSYTSGIDANSNPIKQSLLDFGVTRTQTFER